MAEDKAPAPPLPDPASAYAHILYGLHAPHFFAKLAELGHRPNTEEEARALLELGFMLKAAEAQLQSHHTPYTSAANSLRQLLGIPESEAGREKTAQANSIHAAAVQALQDPAIYAAAASLLRSAGG